MKMRRWKVIIVLFLIVTALIAVLFWCYLNLVARLSSDMSPMQIQLPKVLDTKLKVTNTIHSQAQGSLDTVLNFDRRLDLPLKGAYTAALKFTTVVPVRVKIDYLTYIHIDDKLILDSSTDLIYQNKMLPKLPTHMAIPLKFTVPLHLNQAFDLPIAINFSDEVIFNFDEHLNIPVTHQFKPKLAINDEIQLAAIAATDAQLIPLDSDINSQVQTQVKIPFRNLKIVD